jgi:hypothetical protein
MTDYKQLCAELVRIANALDGGAPLVGNQGQALDGYSALAAFRDVATRARAALADREPDAIKAAMQHPGVAEVIAMSTLAQPKPKEPTKAELRQIFDDQSGFINDEQVMWWSDFQHAARTVLARWGNL